MKRFTRVCLSLSAVFAVAGIVLCIVGAVFGATFRPFRFYNWTFFWNDSVEDESFFSEAYTDKESFVYTDEEMAGVKNLKIDIKAGTLQIQESDDRQVRINVYSRRSGVENKIEGDTLTIEDNRESAWWGSAKLEIYLYLPRDMEFEQADISVKAGEVDSDTVCLRAKRMNLAVDAGSLSLERVDTKEEMNATVGAGEIEIEDLSAEKVDLDCGMGSMEIIGQINGDVNAQCGVGELVLELDDEEENFNYSIECGIGEVEIEDNSYTSFGKTKKIDNHAKKMMNLDCGVGTIEVEFN